MRPNSEKQTPAAEQAPQKRSTKVKTQVVAGFIIFRRTEEGVKYLLLYRRGNYWNFPKGHFESGENSMDTALRETEEETGIKKGELHIIPNFRTQMRFSFRRGEEKIHDTLILYLAETKKAQVLIAPREHSGYAWFLYQDAVKILGTKYIGTRQVLKQANDFIRRGSGANRRRRSQRKNASGASQTNARDGKHPHRPPAARPSTEPPRREKA